MRNRSLAASVSCLPVARTHPQQRVENPTWWKTRWWTRMCCMDNGGRGGGRERGALWSRRHKGLCTHTQKNFFSFLPCNQKLFFFSLKNLQVVETDLLLSVCKVLFMTVFCRDTAGFISHSYISFRPAAVAYMERVLKSTMAILSLIHI